MPDPTDGPHRCTNCDADLPADRSVCPACGTLQHRRTAPIPARPRTIGPIPVEPTSEPGKGEFPGLPADPPRRPPRGQLVGAVAATTPKPPASRPPAAADLPPADDDGPDDAERWDDDPRRSPVLAVAAVVLVALLVGAGALIVLGREDEPAPSASADRVEAVRSFCASPSALGDEVPAWDPSEAGIAFVEHPQPPSSTRPDDEIVVQVAPTLGSPVLTLDASADLVNVALCLEEGVTAAAGGTCTFELTNPGDLGVEVSRPLDRTTYEATLYELRTAEVLSSGPISTPTDACPDFAFTDGDGVSTPLTTEQLVAWLAANVPTGA